MGVGLVTDIPNQAIFFEVKEFEKKFLDLMNLKHRKTLDIIKQGMLTDDVLSTLESGAADLTYSYE